MADATPAAFDAAEIAQGQAAAVLGALARMQLRLDVLSREQSDMFRRLLDRLDELEQALAAVGSVPDPAAAVSPSISPPLTTPVQPWPGT